MLYSPLQKRSSRKWRIQHAARGASHRSLSSMLWREVSVSPASGLLLCRPPFPHPGNGSPVLSARLSPCKATNTTPPTKQATQPITCDWLSMRYSRAAFACIVLVRAVAVAGGCRRYPECQAFWKAFCTLSIMMCSRPAVSSSTGSAASSTLTGNVAFHKIVEGG